MTDNLVMAVAGCYFTHMGMLDPIKKIFITCKHIESLPIMLFTTISLNVTIFLSRSLAWIMIMG